MSSAHDAARDSVMADVISCLQTLYFAMIPLRRYPPDLTPSVIAYLSSSYRIASVFLNGVLDATVRNPLNEQFPIATTSRVCVLKWLVGLAEKRSTVEEEEEDVETNMNEGTNDDSDDPFDALFTIYADCLASSGKSTQFTNDGHNNSDYCYKTFFYPPRVRVSLQESRNYISSGTTGLTSWTASFFMIDWMEKVILKYSSPSCPCSTFPCTEAFHPSSSFLSGKNVLELGSGTGLTGINACLRTASIGSGVKSFRFSDCHPEVLTTLRRNVAHNVPADVLRTNDVDVVELDWSEDATWKSGKEKVAASSMDVDDAKGEEEERSGRLESSWFPDVILGCDIVFDVDVIPYLVRVLKHFLSRDANSSDGQFSLKNPPVAYIASTIRNIHTYTSYLLELEKAGLAVQSCSTTKPSCVLEKYCEFRTPCAPASSFRYDEACVDENPQVTISRIVDRKLRDEMELSMTFMPRVIANEFTEMTLQ